MSNTRTKLSVNGICKKFGPITALDDISFELQQGEFLTMLGPSGSGKTTTLRAIAGFHPLDRGTIFLSGRDVAQLAPNSRNIGMVFQDYALFPHMTVAQNIGFPLEARGIKGDARKKAVSEIIGVVGLNGMEDRKPRQMSGGQQQRVALARALVFKPDLVLLDEPLSALDKKLRATMQLEILRITRAVGATVISVTHDQEEALVMSDRIALFAGGKLVQIGTPQELYRTPSSRFVADFIGDANVFPGKISCTERGPRCVGECYTAEIGPQFGDTLTEGTKIEMIVRPENLNVDEPTVGAIRYPNSLTAIVSEIIYLGVECKIIAKAGSIDLQVRSRRMGLVQSLMPGSPIDLSWRPEDAIFLKPS